MNYKEFEITIDRIDSICEKEKGGKRKYESGFLCRVFSEEDKTNERVLDEFYIKYDYDCINDQYWELTKALEYIDKHYDELTEKMYRLDEEKAYIMLRNLCVSLDDMYDAEEIDNICYDAGIDLDDFYYIVDEYLDLYGSDEEA